MQSHLALTIGGYAITSSLLFAGGLFVLLQNPRRDINRFFFAITAFSLIEAVCIAIALTRATAAAAYPWWLGISLNAAIALSVLEFSFRVMGRRARVVWFIRLSYLGAAILIGGALLAPHAFITHLAPLSYVPFSPVGGWWFYVMSAYFSLIFLVVLFNLFSASIAARDLERKRLEYVFLMMFIGYVVGGVNALNLFGISIDPIFGSLYGLYFLPIAYGVFATDLLDIRIVAKRAVYYVGGVAVITAGLAALIFANDFLVRTLNLGAWTIPLVAAVATFAVGRFVYIEAQEGERLKTEFLTVATHKLRTPLTHIHWLVPTMLARTEDPELKEEIRQVGAANDRLIELTNLLLDAAHTREAGRWYEVHPIDLRPLVEKTVERLKLLAESKKLKVTLSLPPEFPLVPADREHIASAMEVFVENAFTYTPEGGAVHIELSVLPAQVKFSVSDSGIGVKPEDQGRLFASFFRTSAARAADTEGVGLGLSVAKSIVKNHGGEIGLVSEGEGKGSMFWFTLPR